MNIKYIFTSVLLVFISINLNAQISVGLKVNKTFSEYTQGSGISVLKNMGNEDTLYDNYETGYFIAAIFQATFNKYFALTAEPGLSKRRHFIGVSEGLAIIDIFIPFDANRIYFEVPVKFKLRLPLFEDKCGLYTSFGLNASRFLMTHQNDSSFSTRPMLIAEPGVVGNWGVKKLIGVGTDFNFGRHKFLVDCDFSTRLEGGNFLSDFRMKDVYMGVGYMITI